MARASQLTSADDAGAIPSYERQSLRRERILNVITGASLGALIIVSAIARWLASSQTFVGDEIWVLDFARRGVLVPHAVHLPPLFFYPVAAISRLCGDGERCMRLPSEIAAALLTAVPFLMWCTTQTLRRTGAIVATILLAFSSPVSFYAARLKQYSLEALAAAVLLWLFIAGLERNRWMPFALAATFFVLTLHAPVFVLAATGLAVLVAADNRAARIRLVGMHVVFATAFIAAYLGYMKPGPELTRYFGDLSSYYVHTKPMFWDGSAAFIAANTREWLGQMANLTPMMAVTMVLGIAAYGAHAIVSRDRRVMAILVAAIAPAAAVLLASAAKFYPYGEIRLLLFVFPGVVLAFSLAVQWLLGTRPWIAVPVAAAATTLLLLFTFRQLRFDPYNTTYMRASDLGRIYSVLRQRRSPDSLVVCIDYDAIPLPHYVGIPWKQIVKVLPGTTRVQVGPEASEVWTFLPLDVRLDLENGLAPREMFGDGRMRLTRYERVQREK